MTQLRQRMLEELQRRNYAQAIIDAYIFAVQQFSPVLRAVSRGTGSRGFASLPASRTQSC